MSILSQISAGNFTVIPQTCPGGYHLTEQRELAGSGQGVGMTCECLERTEVIACEENQDSIIVRVSKQLFWVIAVIVKVCGSTRTQNQLMQKCRKVY